MFGIQEFTRKVKQENLNLQPESSPSRSSIEMEIQSERENGENNEFARSLIENDTFKDEQGRV